jgi:hypothetical protein
VSLDSRQNSPIAISAARTMQRQSSLSYLRPIPNLPDGPGSEAHSDDCSKSLNRDDVLSTAEASDIPLTQQIGGRTKRRSIWSFFTKNRRRIIINNNNVVNNSDYRSNEASSSILCCSIQ